MFSAFLACFRSTLRVVGEVTTAVLATFVTRFRGTLRIVSEVTATVLATLAADIFIEFPTMGFGSGFTSFLTDVFVKILIVSL